MTESLTEAEDRADRITRSIPEDFWDVAIWQKSGWTGGSLDVADRRRIILRILADRVPDVAAIKAEALRDAADEMLHPSGTNVEIWDGQQVDYVTYERAPHDRTPATWLRDRADALTTERADQ